MLEAAREAAEQRGYEAMRVGEVTDAIGVTRQAFYAHFRDKRQCLCEAIDPKLGAIERMAASLSETDPDAATKLALALDDLIAERFTSAEGTRGRLVTAMIELLRNEGSFHKVRIGTLVRTAHVPPADFYRQFSGKQECFAVAYERLLDELVSDVAATNLPGLLRSFADALTADADRRRILVIEMAHLPDEAPPDVDGARRSALGAAITDLLTDCKDVLVEDPSVTFAAASLVEVIRSTELAGDSKMLGQRLPGLVVNLSRMLGSDASSETREMVA